MSMPYEEVEIPSREVFTYADYARLPEGAPYQLIGGKLIMVPAPTTYHQAVLRRLGVKMANFVDEKGCGAIFFAPVDVCLAQTETYQPDIVFIARERTGIIEPAKINGVPDLVVEILSPATAYYDLREKFKVYARSGVREYWVVDPLDKSVEVYTGKGGSFTLVQQAEKEGMIRSGVLEGFAVEVQEIFVDIP